ncbi:fungal-specific transcription factor domain-containing protein [Aspergillus avenaceus]|uniref:Fungal-specific transcription factor domain-containing protein n=1 Tax=Aspergillus avenaceus TaxID=36643 RepID=A0A5N6TSV7_ASPAV|nr:fungal-specific transcription factor domain-containing protein [Aspergillus avenaceus]
MAIPRLAEGAESAFTSPGRFHRRHVSRACESCRQRKTKCTGDKSGCRNCREAGIICCYTDGKREKSKRQMASLEGKIQAYEDVLRKLSSRFGVSDEQLISLALSVGGDDPASPYHPHSAKQEATTDRSIQPDTSANASEERKFTWTGCSESYLWDISLGSHVADSTEEDFNKDEATRATGFIGKSSEITWLQTLSKEIGFGCEVCHPTSDMPSSRSTPRYEMPIASLNYHLDDSDIPIIDRLDTSELPQKDTATKLFNAYISFVHPSFPIIGISTFASQFQAFFNNRSLKPGNKWLAILNLIFAISARYTHLTEPDSKRDKDNNYHYFLRAKALSIEGQLLQHSDLQQLQVEGLASFYMLASGQINRSWKLCGSAVRGALGLGLHLLNVGSCTSDTSKEIRYRVWWSLYTLDHRLSVMTGRPSCIVDGACTTPLPVPYDESDFRKEPVMRLISRSTQDSPKQFEPPSDSSCNSDFQAVTASKCSQTNISTPCKSLYFLQLIKLTSIAKRMTNKLYSPEGVIKPWSSIEFAIRGLMLDLDSWLMNLPTAYDFTSTQTSQSSANYRMSLALTFYSTKIGITKPCLHRIESNSENTRSEELCRKAAVECVESACHVLRLLPDPPDAVLLHKVSPWWCILHFLMQATAVLLFELTYHAQHVPEKAAMVSKAAKKSYDWLKAMSVTSIASEKAFRLCDGFLHQLGHDASTDTFNIPCIANFSTQVSTDDETHDSPIRFTDQTTTPNGIPSESVSASLSPVDHSRASFAPPAPVGLGVTDTLDFMPNEKPSAATNLYDGYLPYDPNTGQITGSFFPSDGDLEIDLGSYYWDEAME